MRLQGKVAVVTGGGAGIGRGIVLCMAKEGADIAIPDIQDANAHAVVKEVLAMGRKAVAMRCDVTKTADVQAAVERIKKDLGRIDILVNNAAMFTTLKMRPFWDIPAAEWDQLMAVNVRGVWLASKAVVPQMRKQGSGRIVNISSAVIWMGRPNYLHYVASKGAVMAMTRSMAKELGEFGINVNAITPGAVTTEVPRATVTPQQKEAIVAAQSIKRPAGTQDLEGTVVFLCSDDAAFITGQTVNVDGGMNFH